MLEVRPSHVTEPNEDKGVCAYVREGVREKVTCRDGLASNYRVSNYPCPASAYKLKQLIGPDLLDTLYLEIAKT